jgi:hypothetical protein
MDKYDWYSLGTFLAVFICGLVAGVIMAEWLLKAGGCL